MRDCFKHFSFGQVNVLEKSFMNKSLALGIWEVEFIIEHNHQMKISS